GERQDRVPIRLEVTLCIPHRERCFAQHVERMSVMAMLRLLRALDGFLDRASHDELARHDAHGLTERRAQHRLADAACNARDEPAWIAHICVRRTYDTSRQHESPCRRIDKQRLRIVQVRSPVACPDLVCYELVRSCIIWNSEQGLGETHENHALLRGQIVFPEEGIEPPSLRSLGAHVLDERACSCDDAQALLGCEPCAIGQLANELFLVCQVAVIDCSSNSSIGRHVQTLSQFRIQDSKSSTYPWS